MFFLGEAMVYVRYAINTMYILIFVISSLLFVQMLQQGGYQNRLLFKWVSLNRKRVFGLTLIWGLILFVLRIIVNISFILFSSSLLEIMQDSFFFAADLLGSVFSLAFTAILIVAMFRFNMKGAKKPLVYTARVKRLIVTLTIVSAVMFIFLNELDNIIGLQIFAGVFIFLFLFLHPYAVALANLINAPIENAIKKKYLSEAKAKLDNMPSLIKIGITGSYGKTSVKYFLGTILAEKYSVYFSPASYNTPMGLTKVIREELNSSHEVFIAEMGARNPGDISELCELVLPSVGIITSIGPAHLETFKTIEQIVSTKFELIDSLPKDGFAVFNADNEFCVSMFENTGISKAMYGIENASPLMVRASNIKATPTGSEFTLTFNESEEVACTTKLLGRANVLNISGCAACAYKLGLTPDEIANGISKIEQVEHRLQIIPANNGITVIDDAFNASPAGVVLAMEVLSSFPGRKIVVTPGMVELGHAEYDENYKFGEVMSDVANEVLLVGKERTRAIHDGLYNSGFDTRNIHSFDNLKEASDFLAKLTRPGDTVIFENDLPDSYN